MFNSIFAQGQAISNLFILILLIATAILILVTGLVLYASFRYRRRIQQCAGHHFDLCLAGPIPGLFVAGRFFRDFT